MGCTAPSILSGKSSSLSVDVKHFRGKIFKIKMNDGGGSVPIEISDRTESASAYVSFYYEQNCLKEEEDEDEDERHECDSPPLTFFRRQSRLERTEERRERKGKEREMQKDKQK